MFKSVATLIGFCVSLLSTHFVNHGLFHENQTGDPFSHGTLRHEKHSLQQSSDRQHRSLSGVTTWQNYFYNLFDYSPKNSDGSCVLVSLIQVMSYYDTFYNDNIIPEAYDCNQGNASSLYLAASKSPGVLRQDYPTNQTQLFYFVEDNMGWDLQMRLMWISNMIRFSGNINDYTSIALPTDRQEILHRFYNNSGNYNQAVCTMIDYSHFSGATSYEHSLAVSGFDAYVKARIDEGKPVILDLGFGNYTHYSHSVVAYHYDDYGIYVNYGQNDPDQTFLLLTPGNYCIQYATTIDFSNMGEYHSDNYISNNTYYCGCGVHEHSFQFYSQYSNTQHHRSCECGTYITENHAYNHHYRIYTTTNHKSYCACGVWKSEPHAYDHSSIFYISGHPYAPCLQCPQIVDLEGGIIPIPGSTGNQTTPNGSFVRPDGVIDLDPRDVQAYLDGLLLFSNGESI